MNDVHVKPKIDPQLGPVEALGVALSVPMGNTEMMKCQELAKPMLAHLARLGWFLVSDGKDEDIKAEMERLRKENEELRLIAIMKQADKDDFDLREVRDEIRLRSEVLRAFPDVIDPREEGYAERNRQVARFGSLLRRERELMGEDWVTNG